MAAIQIPFPFSGANQSAKSGRDDQEELDVLLLTPLSHTLLREMLQRQFKIEYIKLFNFGKRVWVRNIAALAARRGMSVRMMSMAFKLEAGVVPGEQFGVQGDVPFLPKLVERWFEEECFDEGEDLGAQPQVDAETLWAVATERIAFFSLFSPRCPW